MNDSICVDDKRVLTARSFPVACFIITGRHCAIREGYRHDRAGFAKRPQFAGMIDVCRLSVRPPVTENIAEPRSFLLAHGFTSLRTAVWPR